MTVSLNSEQLRLIIPKKDRALFWILKIWILNSNLESNCIPKFLTREERSRLILDKQ